MDVIHHDSARINENAVYKDLLHALESARTQLAIAIAAETKATPLDLWRYYLDTADQMRRCLKELRKPGQPAGHHGWLRALEALRQMPHLPTHKWRHGEALRLCRILRGILADLDPKECE